MDIAVEETLVHSKNDADAQAPRLSVLRSIQRLELDVDVVLVFIGRDKCLDMLHGLLQRHFFCAAAARRVGMWHATVPEVYVFVSQ